MAALDQQFLHFPAAETHLVHSKYVQQTFKIQVMLPLQKRAETRRFPVVYVTDGNAAFDMLKGVSLLLQQSERESPPFFLVAIGYPSDSPAAGWLLRGRDLTFPGCPNYFSGHQVFSEFEGVLHPEVGAKGFSGGEDFQQFIGNELIPFIDAKYSTLPTERTYFGHSMGGGFGLFTLFTKTDLFRNYICSSPTVVYDGVTPSGTAHQDDDFILARARAFIAAGKSLEGTKLYISVGTEEQFDPLIAQWGFVSGFYRLISLLKQAAVPGLTLIGEAFSNESHTTVWPIAFTHGVQTVFGTRRVASGIY